MKQARILAALALALAGVASSASAGASSPPHASPSATSLGQEVTAATRRSAARAAIVVAVATFAGLALAARRLRAKASEEAAERALAEEFEHLEEKR